MEKVNLTQLLSSTSLGPNFRVVIVILVLMMAFLECTCPVVLAKTETITLKAELNNPTTITRTVELKKNDHLVGSFNISTRPWQDGLQRQWHSLSVSLTFLDPQGLLISSYTASKGDSFDYSAFSLGVYKIELGCSYDWFPPPGFDIAQVTLNYNVVAGNANQNSNKEFSETFSLPPLNQLHRDVDLQRNDHLAGSFSVNNLQHFQMDDVDQTYSVEAEILSPQGNVLASYPITKGDSFDYTANFSGVYKIIFDAHVNYTPDWLLPYGVENPKITLNYTIVSALEPTPTSQLVTPPNQLAGNQSIILLSLSIFVIAISIGIAAIILWKRK